VWFNLPTVIYGILSLIAALFVLILPETLNKTLPQTIEDTEQMGLAWYVYLTDKVF
jgi:OCT family organic cation transporter-like MFS transporter 4/5